MTINEFAAMSYERAMSNVPKGVCFDADYFATATAGEGGEICNARKKYLRGDYGEPSSEIAYSFYLEKLSEECVDTITYALLTLSSLALNPELEIMKKYEVVNRRLAAGGFDKRPE